LRWAGAEARVVKEAFDALRSLQRKDSGWAQLSNMKSDAYATGSAMTILSEAGMDTSNDAYQKGIAFLMASQHDDGSWHVKSRSKAFQKYFESGYPHKKDQFISISAGSWATMALLRAQPVTQRKVTADSK
jgi:squalene cyclase